MNQTITVTAKVDRDIDTVWKLWNEPEHIVHWAFASDDWEARAPENDVREGGKFKTTMAAKDGSTAFDFTGVYTAVKPSELLTYTMDDGRTVIVSFESIDGGTRISQTFEMERENSEEVQRSGWQAILNNFKAYAEGRGV